MTGRAPRRIGVVVPARDEEELVGRCVASVFAAARGVAIPVDVIVVANGCRDGTAATAHAAGAEVIELATGNVGVARRTGSARALELGGDWLAHTDADSEVPEAWLAEQAGLAENGADVVLGTVRPRFDDLDPVRIHAWIALHPPGAALGHVHGANLGVRASAYRDAGGFDSSETDEDVALVDRLRGAGCVVATDRIEVLTSGRLESRVENGYARYLRELSRDAPRAGSRLRVRSESSRTGASG